MAIIYSYPLNTPKPADLLIGTIVHDEDDDNSPKNKPTVSFTVQSILDLVGGGGGAAQNLQQVTNLGATTTNTITITSDIKVSGRYYDSSNQPGATGQILSSTNVGTQWINNTSQGVTSIGLSMPAAFSVTNSPITTSGVLTVTGSGNNTQFIDGAGNLQLISTIPGSYVLPVATNIALGGIKIGYTEAGKNYPLELSNEQAYVNVPWTDTVYTLPLAANGTRGGVQIGYVENAKNYPVELSSEKMFVNVPWTDTTYTLPVATTTDLGGVKIGYTTDVSARNYAITLDAEQMLVNVPWTDTQNPFQTITGAGSNNTDSGVLLSNSGGTVLILGAGSVVASQSSNTITLTGTDTDTGITGVTVAIANSTGAPLSESITNRELTLTSHKYVGGTNVGYVPEGGTTSTYLKGDGTWAAIPTGLQFKGTWDASGTGGGNPDLTTLTPSDGWLYIVSVAGSAAPNGSGVAPNSWNVGDWCVYDGSAWTRVPSSTAGVTTVNTTDGTYINLTPNTATAGNVVVTADLSAVNGNSDTTTRFLSKDNTWDVPSYTGAGVTTFTNTNGTFISAGTENATATGAVTVGTIDLSATGLSGTPATAATQFLSGANTWSVPPGTYTLPLAANGTRGGVQIGYTTDAANRNYAIQLSSEKMFANVPWTDTQENTTWYVRDFADADKTVNNSKYLKFVTATGTLGTALTGTGTTTDPYLMTLTSPDTNTQNTYDLSVEQNSGSNTNPILKLAGSGGPDNITITGTGATTVTRTSATAFTINSLAGSYQWKVRDTQGTPVNKTIANDEFLQFETATGALGTALTGTGTTLDPYLMTLTSPNTTYNVVTTSADGLVPTLPDPHADKFLRGDATWVVPTGTTYDDFISSTASAAGTAGLVPAPAAGTQGGTYYLNGDASFSVPPNTWIANAVTVAGYVAAPAATDANLVWKTNGSGEPDWRVDADTQPITYTLSVAAPGSNNTNVTITPSSGTASTIQLTAGTFIKTTPNAASAQTTLDLSASGTASNSTFLRGDNAWATPPNDDTQYTAGTGLSLSNANEFSIDSTVVTLTGTQTLTNKTLTTPVIDQISPSAAILQIDGAGSVDGGIKLMCYAGTHGQLLKSQPHSEGITNTMLLPKGASSTLVSEVSTSTLTNKSGNISMWTNDSGYITSYNNYYLNGITKSGNVLTFSVSGTTNQTYTFGSNAFNSTTIPTNNNQLTNGAGYITSYTETDTLATVTGRGATTATACSFTNTTSFLIGGSGSANLYLGNIISPSSSDKGARFHSSNNDFYMDFQGDATQNWFLRDYDGSGGTHDRFGFNFINGTFTATGDVVAFGSPSDIRLKENIKPIKSALDKAMKLQGVTFDWKENNNVLDLKEDIGFIAQDIQKVLPELVRENKDGMLSMRHQGITPILLEAIKELKAEIEELKLNKCNCNK